MRTEEAGGAADIQSQVNVKVARWSRSWVKPVNSASSEGRWGWVVVVSLSPRNWSAGGPRDTWQQGWANGSSEYLMQMQ